MKTITEEVKTKIIAQYYGCLCLCKVPNNTVKQRLVVDGDLLSGEGKNVFTEAEILVKPLSEMTNEDATNLAKLLLSNKINDYLWNPIAGKELSKYIESGKCWSFYYQTATNWISGYQYLQLKGYALPYLDYSVADLIELGVYRLEK